jgi:broad specificity phosphatase PhoE
MGLITLIRHGQAGSRTAYDDLSETGHAQSRALGSWFARHDVNFDTMISGSLIRQRITAEEIAGLLDPALVCDPDSRWSEFDLDRVYAGIGPQLAREDEVFRAEYEELQREIADPGSAAHRAWRNCDVTVVRAWIEGRFEFEGESFAAFQERVWAAFRDLSSKGRIAVVTSATPIALCAGMALDLRPVK